MKIRIPLTVAEKQAFGNGGKKAIAGHFFTREDDYFVGIINPVLFDTLRKKLKAEEFKELKVTPIKEPVNGTNSRRNTKKRNS